MENSLPSVMDSRLFLLPVEQVLILLFVVLIHT